MLSVSLLPCRKLGLDLVPRVENEMVDGEAISVVELYKVVNV